MEINITEAASRKIEEKTKNRGYLKLLYDIDGCGCAVNGVAVLSLERDLDNNEVEIQTNGNPLYIQESRSVFFDEKMTLDFSSVSNCFQLKSPGEILNGRMSLIDRTKI